MKVILDTLYIAAGFVLGLLLLIVPIAILGFILEVTHHFTKLLFN